MQIFSAAQCLGYLAFVLGVSAFLQKEDRRLKQLMACECLAYTFHFWMLGNLPASTSACISGGRCLLALKTRSRRVAAAIVALNILLGIAFAKSTTAWFPITASCLGTVAVFLLNGLTMRLVLLVCTFLWLANNILTGSIGGTLLETVIAVANITTMLRLCFSRNQPAPGQGQAAPSRLESPRVNSPSLVLD